jgi:flagellin-specific chaperone FliS
VTRTSPELRLYREQELSGKTPEELLLFVLDTGVRAARRRDRRLLTGVLTELMGGLDFTRSEIPLGLLALYDYAVRETRENRFAFPERLLSELAQAFRHAQAASRGERRFQAGQEEIAA